MLFQIAFRSPAINMDVQPTAVCSKKSEAMVRLKAKKNEMVNFQRASSFNLKFLHPGNR